MSLLGALMLFLPLLINLCLPLCLNYEQPLFECCPRFSCLQVRLTLVERLIAFLSYRE